MAEMGFAAKRIFAATSMVEIAIHFLKLLFTSCTTALMHSDDFKVHFSFSLRMTRLSLLLYGWFTFLLDLRLRVVLVSNCRWQPCCDSYSNY